jgi:NTE family protein
MRRALVLGCGGTVGGAWTVGALAALADHLRWDPREASVIVGTSAGASLAAMLGAGIDVAELVAAQRGDASAPESVRTFFTRPPRPVPPVPRPGITSRAVAWRGLWRRDPVLAAAGLAPIGRGTTAFLDGLADGLVGSRPWVDHPATWLVAIDLASTTRVAFGARGMPVVPLRHALRASWAIPGWFPPVTAHGRRYADGGIASPASADLVKQMDVDEVVVVAPMASTSGAASAAGVGLRLEALALRRRMSRVLTEELAQLRRMGLPILHVLPTGADLTAMGPNFMDPRRRLAALDIAAGTVPGMLEQQGRARALRRSG